MARDRPKIPEDLKRRVRQQCAFGCVLCGKPVFDYDHIIEYSKVECHEFENLVLLCKEHHGAKTQHSLNIDLLKAKRLNPYNRDRTVSSPYGFPAGNNPYMVIIGNNRYPVMLPQEGSYLRFPALTVGEKDVISISIFREGDVAYSLPSVHIEDENQKRLLLIEEGQDRTYENAMTVGIHNWDIECTNKKICIRKASRKIILDIEYQAMGIWLKRATFHDQHGKIDIREDGVHLGEFGLISEDYAIGGRGGLVIA